MQPMYGLKLAEPDERPTCFATNVTDREVVIPGLTGLPKSPRKLTSMARLVSRASRPPTM